MTFKTFWIFIRKCAAKPYSCVVFDTILASDNLSRLRKNILERMTLIIDDKVKDGKLQHNINREAAKISTSFASKIDKPEFLTAE